MGTNQYEYNKYSKWIGRNPSMVEIYINLDITFDIKRDIYSIFVKIQCSNENRKNKSMIYNKRNDLN